MGTKMTESDSCTVLTLSRLTNLILCSAPCSLRSRVIRCKDASPLFAVCAGEVGGAGFGLPGVWRPDDGHAGVTALLFPLDPAS